MKTFVIGDIHGNVSALESCLNQANFDKDIDQLISLGDLCDRGTQTKACITLLLTIKNLILIQGNHDQMFLDWIMTGVGSTAWLTQGGLETIESYTNLPDEHMKFFRAWEMGKEDFNDYIPPEHIDLLKNAKPYYLDKKKRLFVHAGINIELSIEENTPDELMCNRSFFTSAIMTNKQKRTKYSEIYLGHTSTLIYGKSTPINIGKIWNIDTGSGYPDGKLTIMNVDTKEYWQS